MYYTVKCDHTTHSFYISRTVAYIKFKLILKFNAQYASAFQKFSLDKSNSYHKDFISVYSVVVWNLATGDAICGSPAQVMSAGMTHTLAYANLSDDIFVTGGK